MEERGGLNVYTFNLNRPLDLIDILGLVDMFADFISSEPLLNPLTGARVNSSEDLQDAINANFGPLYRSAWQMYIRWGWGLGDFDENIPLSEGIWNAILYGRTLRASVPETLNITSKYAALNSDLAEGWNTFSYEHSGLRRTDVDISVDSFGAGFFGYLEAWVGLGGYRVQVPPFKVVGVCTDCVGNIRLGFYACAYLAEYTVKVDDVWTFDSPWYNIGLDILHPGSGWEFHEDSKDQYAIGFFTLPSER